MPPIDPIEERPFSVGLVALFLALLLLLALWSWRQELFRHRTTWTVSDRLYLERLYRFDPSVGPVLLDLYLRSSDLPAACRLVREERALIATLGDRAPRFLADCFFSEEKPDPFWKEALRELARRHPSLELAEVLQAVGLFGEAAALLVRLFPKLDRKGQLELLPRIVKLYLAMDRPKEALLVAEQLLQEIEHPTPELYRLLVKTALLAGAPKKAARYARLLIKRERGGAWR